jgi:predicted 3-demethylubiquinone-9 3-methyltransferase (glyoxalase superfamily)
MFYGEADKALELYMAVFPDAALSVIERYEDDTQQLKGRIKQASWELYGQQFIVINSPPVHNFGFTPAMSIFVTVHSTAEFEDIFRELSEGGEVFMPPDNYGFSSRFGWTKDRFGMSWQINQE